MNTPVFTSKLDTLFATLELFRKYNTQCLAEGLASGDRRHALAIGSGGSAIAAEYLARCRDTLNLGPTVVLTPMQAALEFHDLTESEVWLFSAGGDNPDSIAAARSAIDRGAHNLHLVTRNSRGVAAGITKLGGGTVHNVPVVESKDGYLATHSLLSFIAALLLASDDVSRDPRGPTHLLDALASRIVVMRDHSSRSSIKAALSQLHRGDTIVIASDPLLRPTSVLFDTSIWEASLCHVQTVDFRNLAHGRHAWLHHRIDESMVLSLTGKDSRMIWDEMDALLPSPLRRLTLYFGACGRLDNALALIDGLGVLEAMGSVLGIDPGRPGIGDFGRAFYENRSLADLAKKMPPGVRHKRAAIAKSDSQYLKDDHLFMIANSRLKALSEVKIGGAVFDYDGTIVSTSGRYSLPEQVIVDELVRLHGLGLAIAFATGRGGSAGEALRSVLPVDILPSILVGYYNGGHIRTADIDIKFDRPQNNPAILETSDWLSERAQLFVQQEFKQKEIQITIGLDKLRRPYRFPLDLEMCPPFSKGLVRITGSGHSYDIVPAATSKLAVVKALENRLPPSTEVVCFGDSGSQIGNDHAFLSHRLGISVGDVCGKANGSWSLFGASLIGPDALLRILRSMVSSKDGKIHIDIASLKLD